MNKDILPQGDYIRQLLIRPTVTESNINSLLRSKGVFLGRNEKNNSIPLLMKSVIGPRDFSFLYETQKNKEESFKYRTSSIKCQSDFDFSTLFSDGIDIHSLIINKHTYKPNYKVVGNPSFYIQDQDTATFEYSIERENVLSDWTNNKTYHQGGIILKRVSDSDIQISVQLNSTSKETFEVNDLVMKALKEELLAKSIIRSNNDIITVKFNHFDNTSRIFFLYSFSSTFSIYLNFKSITDIDLYLDENVPSHQDVEAFLEEIYNLKLSGKGLQNHILLTKPEYFPKLIFGGLVVKYKIDYLNAEGSAIVNFGFPDYAKSNDESADFQISIELLLNRQNKNASLENNIRKKLLEMFEIKKVESYERFRIR